MAQVPALKPSVIVVWPIHLARMASGLGLALLSVLLLVLALPPWNAWPLIFVGFVPMVLAWYRVLPGMWSSLAPAITFSAYAYIFVGKVLDNAPGLPAVVRLVPLARETGTYLVVPYVVETPAGLRNEVVMVGPDGSALGVYHKAHPVPGELAPAERTYPVFDTPLGRLAAIVCYDVDFLDTARHVSAGGAQVVAVPSADWPSIANLHYTHLVFRALEKRISLVKADWSFDSAAIDPRGRIVARAVDPTGVQTTLLADVALGSGPTVATRIGDLVGWIAVATMIAFAVAEIRQQRTATRRGASQ